MDIATEAAAFSAAPDFIGDGLTSAALLADGGPSRSETSAKDHKKSQVSDPTPQTEVNSQGDETVSAPISDEAFPKPDMNGRRETRDSSPLQNEAMPTDAVNGDKSLFAVAPMPLTNGHQKDPVAAPGTDETLDDTWSPATKLKRRLEETKDLIVCPGVYDGFSARIALSVGFDAMYMVRTRFFIVSEMIRKEDKN